MQLADRHTSFRSAEAAPAVQVLSELNQATYQRLKLSLSLNLRRQVFLAVCDDLALRNRLIVQLHAELEQSLQNSDAWSQFNRHSTASTVENVLTELLQEPAPEQTYPQLVSLTLNLEDPDPIAQVGRWLVQYPPPAEIHQIRHLPAFQMLGVEHLTRQTSFVQQRFLIYLQQIERSLSSLESGLLLWLTRPWLNAVQQSAPAFWNCHTALFEFEGDPTPVTETPPVCLTDHDPTVSHNAAVADADPSSATEPPMPSAGEIDRLHEKISGPGGPPELEPTREIPAIDTDKSLLEIEEELEFFPGAIAAGEDLSTNGQEPVAFGENLWDILTYDLAILDDYQDDLPELAGPVIETEVISSELLEVPTPQESEAIADTPDTPTSDSPIADSPVLDNSATGTLDSASQAPTLNFEAEELELSAPRFDFEAEAEELDLQGTELMQSLGSEPIASEPVTVEPEAAELVTPELATPELVVAESASLEETQTDEASAAIAPAPLLPTTETESFPSSLISQLYPGFSLPDMVHDSIRQSGDHSASGRNGEILQLLKQIETLHRRQGTQAEKTEAYRLLGNLYRDRIEQGEISYQNLLIAIFAYEQALTHLEDDNAPLWSDGLNDIGNLYWMLSRQFPDPEMSLSYLEQGIAAYQLALSKTDPKTRPQSYAMIQNNLGSAYGDLARYQMSAEILQRSVAAYEEALRYRKLDDDPARYAATQNNLGTAYWNLAQYQQPVRCLRQAITAYQEALQYYTRDREPMHYAMIQNNLGTAYWNLAQHAKSAPEEAASNGNGISATELLIQAVKAYGTALFFRTLEASPAAHAATQNNLGTAYWHLAALPDLSPEDHQQCLQRAITAYQAALAAVNYLKTAGTAYAPALTFDPCATESNLGLAYYHLAIDPQIPPAEAQRYTYLEAALQHQLQALQGWEKHPDYYQTALTYVVQIIRTVYAEFGARGQNIALSKVPASLLPELMKRL